MPKSRQILLVVSMILALPLSAYAQASIAGVVKDASGAVLPGVTVEATSPVLIEKARTAVTDGEGRARDFTGTLLSGSYRVRFDVAAYFRESDRECFYDEVVVSIRIDGTGHYHVPLLLSPFGYTTYRGS